MRHEGEEAPEGELLSLSAAVSVPPLEYVMLTRWASGAMTQTPTDRLKLLLISGWFLGKCPSFETLLLTPSISASTYLPTALLLSLIFFLRRSRSWMDPEGDSNRSIRLLVSSVLRYIASSNDSGT